MLLPFSIISLFFFLWNLYEPTAAVAVRIRDQTDGDDSDVNYSKGPPLAGTVILAVVASILVLLMVALVALAVKKWNKNRYPKRCRTSVLGANANSWASSRHLRVNDPSWETLPSTVSSQAEPHPEVTLLSAAPADIVADEARGRTPSPFRSSFPITIPLQARGL